MTRDQRADELLREALAAVDHCRDFYEPEDDWRDLGDAIRAYLDEPHPAREHVWRITTPVENRPVLLDHHPVKREWQAKITRIERAQIGPWESVDD